MDKSPSLNTPRRSGLWGGLLALAGVWLLLAEVGVGAATELWPLFWVVAGLLVWAYAGRARVLTIVAVLMVVGGILGQANVWELSSVTLGDVFVPVILITLGVTFLTKAPSVTFFGDNNEQTVSEKKVDCTAVFGSQNRRVVAKDFAGGEVTAVFGGVELDLRESTLAKGAQMEATVVFGGIKLWVDKDVEVAVSGIPVFGGIEDKTVGGGKQTLRLEATAVFGGIEILN